MSDLHAAAFSTIDAHDISDVNGGNLIDAAKRVGDTAVKAAGYGAVGGGIIGGVVGAAGAGTGAAIGGAAAGAFGIGYGLAREIDHATK